MNPESRLWCVCNLLELVFCHILVFDTYPQSFEIHFWLCCMEGSKAIYYFSVIISTEQIRLQPCFIFLLSMFLPPTFYTLSQLQFIQGWVPHLRSKWVQYIVTSFVHEVQSQSCTTQSLYLNGLHTDFKLCITNEKDVVESYPKVFFLGQSDLSSEVNKLRFPVDWELRLLALLLSQTVGNPVLVTTD